MHVQIIVHLSFNLFLLCTHIVYHTHILCIILCVHTENHKTEEVEPYQEPIDALRGREPSDEASNEQEKGVQEDENKDMEDKN